MRRNPIRSRHPTPLRLACFDEYFSLFDVVPLFFLSLLGPQGDANWPEASSYSLFCFLLPSFPLSLPSIFFPQLAGALDSEPNTKKKSPNKTKQKKKTLPQRML